MSTVVVYVHGLWLNGWESVLLRRRLSRQLGCRALSFRYSSVGRDVTANARALGEFLRRTRADTVHLVGHSLGGLVILALFESLMSADGRLSGGLPLPPGRIVLLGSPVQGSRAARNLARTRLGRHMLGRTAADVLLLPRERRWSGTRDLGVIAGDLGLGLGRLVGPLDAPNDGTVLVAETRIEGARQHLTLRISHSALVYSGTVAGQTAAFLRDGRFAP